MLFKKNVAPPKSEHLPTPMQGIKSDTMYMNVSADSSSVTIVGLDGSLAYSVQVSAGTRAGQEVQNTAQVAGITEGERSDTSMYRM